MAKKEVSAAVVFSFLLVLIAGCQNNLPENTINVSVKTMENVCTKNGFSYELSADGSGVECIFHDGSSCNAMEYYKGKCYPKPKVNLQKLYIRYLGEPTTVSSVSVTLGFSNTEIMPMAAGEGPVKQVVHTFHLQPEISGASATRDEILVAGLDSNGMNLDRRVASVVLKTSSDATIDDIWVESVSIIDMSGEEIGDMDDIELTLE